ncbi:MAG: MFS transporter [Sphingobium sp.]
MAQGSAVGIDEGSRLFQRQRVRKGAAGIFAASLACLQPGIDPVFLTLLSAAHAVNPVNHGWIVGATQSGMALGSLVVLRLGSRIPWLLFPLAALVALLASLTTASIGQIAALLPIRGCYGFGMGIIYTHCMSSAAAWRPNGAYGAVFLIQLVLSTVVALILPAVASSSGPALALAMLAFVPVAALIVLLLSARLALPGPAGMSLLPDADERHPTDAAGWALALASLLFICTTMMVWSFTGALATAAHISEAVIGRAVAIGSVAGAITALFVMREKPVVPLPLTGLLAGLSLLAPIVAIPGGQAMPFILSVILLNIGSTAIIIRCSGMATARSRDPLFRRLVAFTHSGGMILGPATGSVLTSTLGPAGLEDGAILAIVAGCAALLFAAVRSSAAGDGTVPI